MVAAGPVAGSALATDGGRPLDALVAELVELLRIPSISSRAGWEAELARAADWIAAAVRRAGGSAEVLHEGRNPLVVGRLACGCPGAPRLLLYGHYDVQDPGPLEGWSSPPFEPQVRDGCLYARGAADDKGGLHALLAAASDLACEGRLPCDVTLLADGEEEVAGDSAIAWLAAADERHDAAIVFDTVMTEPGRPQLTTGLRGCAAGRVVVRTGARALHSGLYGGAVLNAAHVLADLLAAVAPREGRLPAALTEGVLAPAEEERRAWAELPSPSAVVAAAGGTPADPAAAAELYERTFARPSLDVLGVSAGEVDGVDTAIPARAQAIVSLRLAAGQQVEPAWAALRALLRERLPDGATLEDELLVRSPPWAVAPGAPLLRSAREAIAAASGAPCALVRCGGSIPLVAALGAAGIPAVLSGVALPGDGIHAADERIPLDSYALAYRMARALICTIGQPTPPAASGRRS